MASNGQPIAQTTRLQQTSVTLYVGAGATADDTSHGHVVNGQGYTRVQPREPVRTTPLYQGGPQTSSGAGRIATGLTAVPR